MPKSETRVLATLPIERDGEEFTAVASVDIDKDGNYGAISYTCKEDASTELTKEEKDALDGMMEEDEEISEEDFEDANPDEEEEEEDKA